MAERVEDFEEPVFEEPPEASEEDVAVVAGIADDGTFSEEKLMDRLARLADGGPPEPPSEDGPEEPDFDEPDEPPDEPDFEGPSEPTEGGKAEEGGGDEEDGDQITMSDLRVDIDAADVIPDEVAPRLVFSEQESSAGGFENHTYVPEGPDEDPQDAAEDGHADALEALLVHASWLSAQYGIASSFVRTEGHLSISLTLKSCGDAYARCVEAFAESFPSKKRKWAGTVCVVGQGIPQEESTEDFLADMLEAERFFGRRISESEGNDVLLRVCRGHQLVMEQLLSAVKAGGLYMKDEAVPWLCLECHCTHVGTNAPDECPVCHAEQTSFIPFEDFSPYLDFSALAGEKKS